MKNIVFVIFITIPFIISSQNIVNILEANCSSLIVNYENYEEQETTILLEQEIQDGHFVLSRIKRESSSNITYFDNLPVGNYRACVKHIAQNTYI